MRCYLSSRVHNNKSVRLLCLCILIVCTVFEGICAGEDATGLDDGRKCPDFEDIKNLLLSNGIDSALAPLGKCESLNLSKIHNPVSVVLVQDRVPPLEWVIAEVQGEWKPILFQKGLVPCWERTASDIISSLVMDYDDECSIAMVAKDMAAVFVDSEPHLGLVLLNRDSIPTDYTSSDALRDLLRAGKTEVEAREILLRGVSDTIEPPMVMENDGIPVLVFVTWHYYGGVLVRWHFMLMHPFQAKRTVLAVRVGSYDYYQ